MVDGDLVVFSPGALTSEVKRQASAMGTVKYLIAPDVEHHLFLDDWHNAYPHAKLIGPQELKVKRERMKKPLPWTYLWKKGVPPSVDPQFDQEFDYTFVWAHPNHELVFFHKPTKTLVQADLMFNLPATEQYSRSGTSATSGYLTKAFISLTSPQSTWGKRFTWYFMSSNDRPSFDQNIRTIDKWPFDRMIPCHGNVVESGAHPLFRKAFSWHLDGHTVPGDLQ